MRMFGLFDRRGEVLPAILIAGLVMGAGGLRFRAWKNPR